MAEAANAAASSSRYENGGGVAGASRDAMFCGFASGQEWKTEKEVVILCLGREMTAGLARGIGKFLILWDSLGSRPSLCISNSLEVAHPLGAMADCIGQDGMTVICLASSMTCAGTPHMYS